MPTQFHHVTGALNSKGTSILIGAELEIRREHMQRKLTNTVRTITAAALLSAVASVAVAVPADPGRPLVAQTCSVAMTRLVEAQSGSPLLSADEQAQILRMARADVARLCDGGQRDGLLQDPSAPNPDEFRDADRVDMGLIPAPHPFT